MKPIFYLLLPAAALLMACSGHTGYTITGTVRGASDGDTVWLSQSVNREIIDLDSAIIRDETFTMKGGKLTGVEECMLIYQHGDDEESMRVRDFFLENGRAFINSICRCIK